MKLLLLSAFAISASAPVGANDTSFPSLRGPQARKLSQVRCNGPNAARPCPEDRLPYTCEDGEEMCCKWSNLPWIQDELSREIDLGSNFGLCTLETRDGELLFSSQELPTT